ncbi:MAG TPA: 23S rRNA (uracil(1939)-C(5))-methyltransferase RlmD [Flavobacteriales bacterium]|jgi:23S rRNA (uracil1939-C5)-methyltransferase|nr:23S rRNA (uracil(1939)-C(5))-methyltransferase RlmD [Flavobacteriales bacterium]
MKLKRGEICAFEIEDIAFGGKGIARINSGEKKFVVFIPNTIPGQTVRARISKKRSSFAEAKLLEVVSRAPEEIENTYQRIPGAPYATWPIKYQQKYKWESVIELYRRVAKIENPESLLDEFISSPRVWHYRNKMEYSFSTIGWDFDQKTDIDGFFLGFKKRGQWRIVENLDRDSGLFDQQFENFIPHIRNYLESTKLTAWHPVRHNGFYRFLTVRKSQLNNNLLVGLTTTSDGVERFRAQDFYSFLNSKLDNRCIGLIHSINDDQGDRGFSIQSGKNKVYGERHLKEDLLGLNFQVDINSFFQPNKWSAELLYNKAMEYLFRARNFNENDAILDLFCGTGTLAQLAAARTESDLKIIGIDIVEEAISDARKNAKENGLQQIEFIASDVKHIPQLLQGKRIQAAIIDPPRGGIAPRSLQYIMNLKSPTLVYISCNPSTQARDIEILLINGYRVEALTIVDQFPHTSHVETITLLTLN